MLYGPLTRYVKLPIAHAPGMLGTFSRLQGKPLVSDAGIHRGTCVTHVSWCMSGSLTRGGGENVPGTPGACAIRNSTYLVRGPWRHKPTVSAAAVIFQSFKAKFDQNLQCSSLKYRRPITAEFCTRHDSVTDVWLVEHILNQSAANLVEFRIRSKPGTVSPTSDRGQSSIGIPSSQEPHGVGIGSPRCQAHRLNRGV